MRARTAALIFALAACRRHTAVDAPDAAEIITAPEIRIVDAGAIADAAVARCTSAGGAAPFASEGPVEVGGAATTPTRIAVGLSRTTAEGRIGSIAVFAGGASLGTPTVIDLGPQIGDTPPPIPVMHGEELYAVGYGKATKDGRDLVVSRIADGKASTVSIVSRKKNESLAFDAALGEKGGLVTWDEDVLPARGIIKIAALAPGGPAPRIVSPDASDAESPRIVARPGGFWLVWIARALEPVRDGGTSYLEAPGEDRAYAWLELAALDESGAPVRPVKRITSHKEHVEAFDIAVRNDGADLDVVARQDDEPTDGAGGKLVLHSIHDDAISSRVLVPMGVGRGIPDLFGGWLVFADNGDHTRILPFFSTPYDAGEAPSTSLEPVLEASRPLAVTAAGLVVAFPASPKALFRAIKCKP